MTTKHKLAFGSVLIIILIVAYLIRPVTQFKQLPSTNQPEEVMAKNYKQQKQNSKKLTYIFIWKPGCKDCETIQKKTIKPIHHLQQQKRLIVVNARHKKVISYLHQQNVHFVPTLIVQRNQHKIYQYTGNNPAKFNHLLNGQNPNSKKPLTNHFHNQNDFENN